jgi:thioredoxin 2
MSSSVLVVCPHCDAVNRVPEARLADGPACGTCHAQLFGGHPIALGETRFDRHVQQGTLPLLVDFWAPWCGPCRTMAPAFEQAARQLEPKMRLVKVDTEAEQSLGTRFAIRSIPTLILIRNGREVARQSGAMGAADIQRWALAHL